jgi:dienelactone hydrolase
MRTVSALLVTAAVLAGLTACGPTHHQPGIVVDHPDTLLDQPVHVQVRGLSAGERISVSATAVDAAGQRWVSRASFRADDQGTVDLARARPVGGRPYSTADEMGLLWTMYAPANSDAVYRPRTVQPVTVTATADDSRLARRTLNRRSATPGLRTTRLSLSRDGVHGTLYEPAGGGRHPAVLLFGGSEGGEYLDLQARLLAAHGYPALSIAYFGVAGLPKNLADIPVEYGGTALRYLAGRPDVDPHRIAVIGASRGGEYAELLGVHYPHLVDGVVALTPSNVAVVGLGPGHGPAWTWRGKPVPYTRQVNNPHPTDDPAAVIPVERIAGPVLATCAGEDYVWDSCAYATALMARLTARHDRFDHRLLRFAHAGHFSNGMLPYVPQTADGQAATDEPARAREWPAILHWIGVLPRG